MTPKIHTSLYFKYSAMGKKLILAMVLFIGMSSFSQNARYEYPGGLIPTVNKEKLSAAKSISEITPELWRYLILPYEDRIDLDRRSRVDYAQGLSYFQGYYIYPQEYNYNKMIDYVSVDISVVCNGKSFTSQGSGDKLTMEQKNMLNNADLNTHLTMKIKFKYKNQLAGKLGSESRIVEGKLSVAVVPETEACYTGGMKQFVYDVVEKIMNLVIDTNISRKIRQAIVKFTVNEEGRTENAKVIQTSTDPGIDKLLLDVIHNIPVWKPAQNANGIKVKQEFTVPLGENGGGC